MPSLLFSALPQKGIPEPVEGNPFELLKEIMESNTSKGSKSDTYKPEETAQTKEVTKLIFPSDIKGAEEIYEDPKLQRFTIDDDTKLQYVQNGEYKEYVGNTLSTNFILGYILEIDNSKNYQIEKSCKKYKYSSGGGYDPHVEKVTEDIVKQTSQSTKNYKTNTSYKFIKKIDKKIIFAKNRERIDNKLDPKINGLGELTINLEVSYSAKKFYETTLYVTFVSSVYDSCFTRSIDNYWYDPNELKLIKEQPEFKIQSTEENKIVPIDEIVITIDGINEGFYYDEYNLHERLIQSSLNNLEIKIYCTSCIEQKDYSVKVNIDSYKKNYAGNVKKQKKIKFDKSLAPIKSLCEEIGFIPGTDKFKNCLLEMMN